MLLAACLVAMIACATARPTYNFTIPQAIPPALDQLEEAAKASYIDRAVDAPESGVAEASTRKTVVLVTVSTGYMDFFRNWLYYYRRLVCVKKKKMMMFLVVWLKEENVTERRFSMHANISCHGAFIEAVLRHRRFCVFLF